MRHVSWSAGPAEGQYCQHREDVYHGINKAVVDNVHEMRITYPVDEGEKKTKENIPLGKIRKQIWKQEGRPYVQAGVKVVRDIFAKNILAIPCIASSPTQNFSPFQYIIYSPQCISTARGRRHGYQEMLFALVYSHRPRKDLFLSLHIAYLRDVFRRPLVAMFTELLKYCIAAVLRRAA